MSYATLNPMTQTLRDEVNMLKSVFTPGGRHGRYYIDVEELGTLNGASAARAFAEKFRSQHPALIVEQRNTRVWVTVPEIKS